MKKLIILGIVLITFIGSINAQSNYIDGVWKLSNMKDAGEIYPVNMHVVFNNAGEINISGANVGTWSQNETENTFTISCPYLGVLEGENKIEALNDSELKLSNANGDVNSFQKISLPKNKELHNKITGDWFFEIMETTGKTEIVNQFATFNKNGIFYMQGMVFGTWNYNESSNTIILDNKDFKGEYAISQPNKNKLVLNTDEYKIYFSKIDKQKTINENKESGLIGTWEFKEVPDAYATTFISFKEPDEFTIIQKQEGMTSKFGGIWMFNKEEMSLIMVGLRGGDAFNGENKILKIDGETVALKNNSTNYQGNRKAEDNIKIEHLSFTKKDFYDETGDYKYYDDDQKLPWNSSYKMMNDLANVKQLIYSYSKLIEGTSSFETKTLTANVVANIQEGILSIDNIFKGYDRFNITEDSEMPTNNYDEYNKLFPLDEDTFRVVGEEEITVPAGSFNCTVIEAASSFDENIKLWMINDKPGIIAKVINDKPDESFGHYYIYELQEIK
ncbi:hypothetical protein [Lutibacter sp.]|uniref:hypothetical protein n=1 Tax=Lutibacter sp. TaxID=1925666 RepID=UPI001A33FCC3|nr:hypothetical protein [Lutibacter sp.]MBI9041062.1 hypothetical protein [Lutibacter sp.]